ncbi:MAG: glycerol acyltransferase [Bacteroidia bacterium]
MNIKDEVIEDIPPHCTSEVYESLQKIVKDPIFVKLINYLWPTMTLNDALIKAEVVKTLISFQREFMYPAIKTIIDKTSLGLTHNGINHLDKNKAYLFVANHRDILLDSAILQVLLFENGFNTSKISFGDNLIGNDFIAEFCKLNQMFSVLRDGSARELYEESTKLSTFIRDTISEKNASIWLAQRNGRTKDGLDQTQTGLLKMLNMSGKSEFAENFLELNIIPLTISYEYEPCDYLKVQELYSSSLNAKYVKSPGEDLNSTITGITQQKGHIHMTIGAPINNELLSFNNKLDNDNDKIKKLATLIDQKIIQNYKLWPVNYIAADLINNTNKYSTNYTQQDKNDFITYIRSKIELLKGEPDVLFDLFIKLYSNPLQNKLILT